MLPSNFSFTESFLWKWISKSYDTVNNFRKYYLIALITFGLILLTNVSLLTNPSLIISDKWNNSNFRPYLNESPEINAVT
ncbi:Down syndrome cell adhesion molecule [Schistosoma japonicum]|nr:Down syndrome cell adhesion molecule [Schistosoma japonicum]